MKLTRILSPLAILASLTMFVAPAQAVPIKTALSVVLDGSGSIGSTNFGVQLDAYESVFGNTSVMPADGSVVVNVVQFSTTAATSVELGAIRINNAVDRTTLVNLFNSGISYQNGFATDIAEGIDQGVADMDTFLSSLAPADFAADFQKLVDVSTDGADNQGGNPATSAQNAVNNLGYAAVNCLGIGAGADCSFNDGVGSDFSASSFNDLEPVLERKVRTEIGTIPAPGVVALLGAGLIALGAVQRRKLGAAV